MMQKMPESLTAEEHLIVLASRIDLESEDRTRMEDILKQDLNWPLIKRCSSHLGVSCLLYKHLSYEKYARYVPDEAMRFLKNRYRLESMKNLRLYGRITRILDSMNQANIPIILLKGAFVAKWIYGDIGLRPMSDIDILCREEDVRMVKNKLIELGYAYKKEAFFRTPFHEKVLAAQSKHLPPFTEPKAARVEVHINIFQEHSHNPKDMERLWEAAIPSRLNGRRFYYLSPEYQLLYLSHHLYGHIVSTGIALYWFCDIHEVIKRYKDKIDWGLLWAMGDSLGAGAQARALFNPLITYWNTSIPEKALNHSGAGTNQLRLKTITLKHFLDGDRKRKMGTLKNDVTIIKTLAKIKGAANRFKFLWGYIFPTRAFLIHRYRLKNSSMAYLYHLIHPFKICTRFFVSVFYNIAGFVKSPNSLLRCIFRFFIVR